jgi:hypothetical protein
VENKSAEPSETSFAKWQTKTKTNASVSQEVKASRILKLPPSNTDRDRGRGEATPKQAPEGRKTRPGTQGEEGATDPRKAQGKTPATPEGAHPPTQQSPPNSPQREPLESCSQGTETEELTLKQKRKENRETGDRQEERDTRTKSLK